MPKYTQILTIKKHYMKNVKKTADNYIYELMRRLAKKHNCFLIDDYLQKKCGPNDPLLVIDRKVREYPDLDRVFIRYRLIYFNLGSRMILNSHHNQDYISKAGFINMLEALLKDI